MLLGVLLFPACLDEALLSVPWCPNENIARNESRFDEAQSIFCKPLKPKNYGGRMMTKRLRSERRREGG